MARSLVEARVRVLRRLSDEAQAFWTGAEVDGYLAEAYRVLARRTRCFWDQLYLENLPAGFSMTAPWESAYLEGGDFNYGVANYTLDDERRLLTETDRLGPGNHTSPFEATDEWLNGTSGCGANDAIPATATLPRTLVTMDRITWDNLTIRTLTPSQAQTQDARYEVTKGEVYALIPTKDGIRTVRKVRVPAAQAATYQVTRSWGILREPEDISGATVTGTWGVPRRIPGMHPMGAESFGLPRRPYRDGTNVRVEHWREGRALDAATDQFELPDRATTYAEDYALSECLRRNGPAQDRKLAAHYAERFERGVARLLRRVELQARARIGVMGGGGTIARGAPPRPKLPWQFGQELR